MLPPPKAEGRSTTFLPLPLLHAPLFISLLLLIPAVLLCFTGMDSHVHLVVHVLSTLCFTALTILTKKAKNQHRFSLSLKLAFFQFLPYDQTFATSPSFFLTSRLRQQLFISSLESQVATFSPFRNKWIFPQSLLFQGGPLTAALIRFLTACCRAPHESVSPSSALG